MDQAQPQRRPRAPKKPSPEAAAPDASQVAPKLPPLTEDVMLAVLWHYRHEAGNTLACVVTSTEIEQMHASFEYTKQRPVVAAIQRPGRLIVSVVEKGTIISGPKGEILSAGNEVRPCESTADGGTQAQRAAQRAQMGQQAQDLAQRLLAGERSGTFSAEDTREAARLLSQFAELQR